MGVAVNTLTAQRWPVNPMDLPQWEGLNPVYQKDRFNSRTLWN